jgi:hypothetical protein
MNLGHNKFRNIKNLLSNLVAHLLIMSYQKVALILGSGPNVGRHVSRAFAAKGYKVALASRSLKKPDDAAGLTHFRVELSNPVSIPELFTKVEHDLGAPSVVVYNGQYNGCGTQLREKRITLPQRVHSLQPIQKIHSRYPSTTLSKTCMSTPLVSSSGYLCKAACLGLEDIHLHRQRAEHRLGRSTAHWRGRRQICDSPFDSCCFYGICGPGLQVRIKEDNALLQNFD